MYRSHLQHGVLLAMKAIEDLQFAAANLVESSQ